MMDSWITTFTGRQVDPLNLKPEDIEVVDIAHHLACINRFVGALRTPVSVAQHSVYVSRLCDGNGWEMEALFHDATEAYLGDVSKWVKRMDAMREYRKAEDRAWMVICEALGLRIELPRMVDDADALMVRFEALRQLKNPNVLFALPTHPRPTQAECDAVGKWQPWGWRNARQGFIDHYRLLGGRAKLPNK